jgi:hypothetical protein
VSASQLDDCSGCFSFQLMTIAFSEACLDKELNLNCSVMIFIFEAHFNQESDK